MNRSLWKQQQLGNMLLLCVTEGQPDDADIDASLALHRSEAVKTAILWAIGSPAISAAQRKRTAEAMGKHRNYVVTTSAMTRGIITAISWLGQPMKACAPSDVRAAIRDLGVPEGYTEEQVEQALLALKVETENELLGQSVRKTS